MACDNSVAISNFEGDHFLKSIFWYIKNILKNLMDHILGFLENTL